MTSLFTTVILLFFTYNVYGKENNPGPRIVGGEKVVDRSLFAYQVSLRINKRHYCGGTIIDEQHILTAAHCCFDSHKEVFKPSSIEVYAGDLNLHEPQQKATQRRKVKYIFTHPDYNSLTLANDIALIRVKKNFTLNENVNSLGLSSQSPIAGHACIVSGWGEMKEGSGRLSENLIFVPVPILEEKKCKYSYITGIRPGMFCAGYLDGNADSCQGDSGGPLACNRTTLTGITSWGAGCARPGYPGVYTDVSYFKNWVENEKLRSSSNVNLRSIITMINATYLEEIKYIKFSKNRNSPLVGYLGQVSCCLEPIADQ